MILLLYLGYLVSRSERNCARAKARAAVSSVYLKIEKGLARGEIESGGFLEKEIQTTLWEFMKNPMRLSYSQLFSHSAAKERKVAMEAFIKELNRLPPPQKKLADEAVVTVGWNVIKSHSLLSFTFWSLVITAFISVAISKGIRYLFESSSKLFRDVEIKFGAESMQRIACHV